MGKTMAACSSSPFYGSVFILLSLAMSGLCTAQSESPTAELTPLPSEAFGEGGTGNPILDMRDRAVDGLGDMAPQIPEEVDIESNGGQISYDSEHQLFRYEGGEDGVRLKTDKDGYLQASAVQLDLQKQEASLDGAFTAYQDDILVRGAEGGTYAWKNGEAKLNGVRAKVDGLIVRGSSIEYHKDAAGKQYMVIHDAFVTTEDVAEPNTWLGTGTLTVYPGEYGKVSRLSVAGKDWDVPVPVLGWFSFSHSLNPREGYVPGIGTRSSWGAYLLNSYGFLVGNRRVKNGIPTADYLVTTHLDYRARRGMATGLDVEEAALADKYKEMKGLSAYYLADSDPMINPTDSVRSITPHERYRIALQQEFDATPAADTKGKWQLSANANVLSDEYVLRDFFESAARVDNKPDNTVRLVRTDKSTQSMIYTRFAPNDFYDTDERLEGSFYRVRSAIGSTGINYETNNSATMMRQYMPFESRMFYHELMEGLRDGELRNYLQRISNTESYYRVNSSHELSTSVKPFRFINITPKTGGGYSGYYDVGGVGSDNRFLGYLGCDVDLKFYRNYPSFAYKNFGLKGLTHVIHPFLSYSQATISSSNELVPRVDYWSSETGVSTTSPMPLDFIGYNGIDGWGQWTVVRIGVQNLLNSRADEDRIRLMDWTVFLDTNVDNPGTDARFSDLYSTLSLNPSRRLRFNMISQTPTIRNGYGYYQYNLNATYMPFSWVESRIGYRCLKDHPILKDAEQVYLQANIRFNERNTFSGRWNFDVTESRSPIQEYSFFRNYGAWYVGATLFIRDNGGKREEGFGISLTLGETGTALPVKFY